MRRQRCVWLVR